MWNIAGLLTSAGSGEGARVCLSMLRTTCRHLPVSQRMTGTLPPFLKQFLPMITKQTELEFRDIKMSSLSPYRSLTQPMCSVTWCSSWYKLFTTPFAPWIRFQSLTKIGINRCMWWITVYCKVYLLFRVLGELTPLLNIKHKDKLQLICSRFFAKDQQKMLKKSKCEVKVFIYF